MNFFKMIFKGSLKKKNLFGYILITSLTLILAVLSITTLVNLKSAINDIMVENYRSVLAAEQMMEALERQDSGELIFLFNKKGEGKKIIRENRVEFIKWLGRAEDNITIEGEGKLLDNINSDYKKYMKLYDDMEILFNKDVEQAQQFYFNEVMPHFTILKGQAQELLLMNQRNMYEAQQTANQNTTEAVYTTLIFSVIVVFLAIFFGLYFSNQIIKPIRELEKKAKQIGEGDLDSRIEIKTKDEIGELAKEFNSMTEKLQEYDELNVQRLVSEKKKSEAIVKSISSPLIVTDSEHKIVLLNPAAEELFDISESQVLKKHFLEEINDEEIFNLMKNTAEKSDENGFTEDSITFQREDTDLHYKTSAMPVFNDSGDLELIVTIFENITKYKELDEMKSEFVSTVSHEFRSPLTSMNMSIKMLLNNKFGEINDKQEELLETAQEDCERLKNLVSDLLDLSKIESGKIEMDLQDTNLEEIVQSSVKPFKKKAEEKNIDLSTNMEQDLIVYADFNKITWVITNLIGNAMRYTPEDEGKINVKAEKKGNIIYVSVKDNGEGIPKRFQDKIFDKFVRVQRDEQDTGGTGLGLAISKEIIEAHGGRIWVNSKPGEGSRFTFTLKQSDKRNKEE